MQLGLNWYDFIPRTSLEKTIEQENEQRSEQEQKLTIDYGPASE